MFDAKSPGYAKIKPPLLRWLFRNPAVAVLSHWAFQSLFYMDSTERWFKLGLDFLLTLLLTFALRLVMSWPLSLLLAFLVAHTLNFTLNGQLWGILKHYGVVRVPPERFTHYASALADRARREPSAYRLVVVGSLARRQWNTSSDLDTRLLRYPGLVNGLRACWFLLKERTRAFWARFPLDLYILDSQASLEKLGAVDGCLDLIELVKDDDI